MPITQVAIVSDLHVNSSVAVCPPRVEVDEGTHITTREQRWLWECWNDFAVQFYAMPGRHIVVINGDVGELDTKRRSLQLVSLNKAVIQRLILQTLDPLVGPADIVYVNKGTSAHVGKSAWLETWLADDLDNAAKPAQWHLQADCEGVRMDIAHHASMSGSQAAKLNAPARLAVDTVYDYAVAGYKPPHVVIRSHNHRKVDTYDNYPVRVIYTGSWSLPTEFVYRTGKYTAPMLSDIGGIILTCEAGNLTVTPRYYAPQRRQIWKAL